MIKGAKIREDRVKWCLSVIFRLLRTIMVYFTLSKNKRICMLWNKDLLEKC